MKQVCKICGRHVKEKTGFRRRGNMCSGCHSAHKRAYMHLAAKEGKPCARCGSHVEPWQLVWRHRDAWETGYVSQCGNQAQLDTEAAKCVLLCRRCNGRTSTHRWLDMLPR